MTNQSARASTAKNPAYSQWVSKGIDDGHLQTLIESIRNDIKSAGPQFDNKLPHHAHMELGFIHGVESWMPLLKDPLGAKDVKPLPQLSPSYADPSAPAR